MNFIVQSSRGDESLEFPRPCFVLRKQSWDDYDYKTLFSVSYLDESGTRHYLGRTKILTPPSRNTVLPSTFESLRPQDLSIGQTPDFYARIRNVVGVEAEPHVLLALRDLTMLTPPEKVAALKTAGVNESLLRHSIAQHFLTLGSRGLSPEDELDHPDFSFECDLLGFDLPHRLRFRFHSNPNILNRIFVLAGNNGAGKSGVLAQLAYALSGETTSRGRFPTGRPIVTRTVVISYSAFQPFKPTSSNSDTYVYCGVASMSEQVTQIDKRFYETSTELLRGDRRDLWIQIWSEFCVLAGLDVQETLDDPTAQVGLLRTVSSGHRMYIQVVQDLVFNLKPRAVLLIDEPETHLHPTLVASFMRRLNELLEQFRSHAVLATHSPIVLQEVPASHLHVLVKDGRIPLVRSATAETFGAALSELCDLAFRMTDHDRNYLTYVEKLLAGLNDSELRGRFKEPNNLNLELALAGRAES